MQNADTSRTAALLPIRFIPSAFPILHYAIVSSNTRLESTGLETTCLNRRVAAARNARRRLRS
ncbi:hypothetical protein, partial [Acinetobacter baumannii]|uniref:hypothetical protein n=1 Tax=Acinetobacter baumannii TaxID=470 RepID=UPI003397038A